MDNLREKAFRFIDSHREEMIDFWRALVNIPTGSHHKQGVDEAAEFICASIKRAGGEARLVEYKTAGNGVVATFGTPTAKAPMCFLGHFDTVFPKGKESPFKIEDGKAYGSGVLDMKGGVVIQIFAARALMAAGFNERQIKIVLAGDEEIAHLNSDMAKVFEDESRGAIAAFNFETGDISNTIVVGRKGTAGYHIEVKGVSVHAGREPEKGRSAILELAHKVIDIQALNDFTSGITFNVGTIKGGIAPNAVPDHAEIAVDVRVMKTEQLKWVEENIKAVCSKTYIDGTSTSYKLEPGIEPMIRSEGNERLFEFMKEVSAEIGFPTPEPIMSGGGSDSAYSVKAGVPTIDQMGVKGQWNHSSREYAVVETLFERAKLAAACVLEIERISR